MGGKSKQFWDSLPRFIWGEAVDSRLGDLDERIFLTHARFPRFVCEIYETDEIPPLDTLDGSLAGAFDQRDGERIWICNAGFFAARWAFAEAAPNAGDLDRIMREAAADYAAWNQASEDFLGVADPDD